MQFWLAVALHLFIGFMWLSLWAFTYYGGGGEALLAIAFILWLSSLGVIMVLWRRTRWSGLVLVVPIVWAAALGIPLFQD